VLPWSKVYNVFHRSDTGIVGSNPICYMDVCVPSCCVCVALCRHRTGLAAGRFPIQGVTHKEHSDIRKMTSLRQQWYFTIQQQQQ
jgi:hypothetical protein